MITSRKSFIQITVSVLLLLIVGTTLYWWQLTTLAEKLRAETLRQAEFRAHQVNGAAAEQISMLFQQVDAATEELANLYVPNKAAAFDADARRVAQRLPGQSVLQVGVIDAKGYLVYSSLGTGIGIFLGDREHFKVHLETEKDRLFISKPVLGRASKQWSIQFSRPVRRNGQLAGVVVLSVSPSYLQKALISLTLDTDDVVAVFRENGDYLARNQDHENSLGKNVGPNRPFVGPVATPNGSFSAVANYDKVRRIFQWQRLNAYPVTVVLSLSEATVLKPIEEIIYRNRSYAAIGTTLLWALVLLAILLMRKVLAQREQVIERSAQLRLMTDSAKDYALIMLDPEGNIISWSDGARRLKGYEETEVLGKSMDIFYTPEDLAAGVPARMRELARQTGRSEEEGWRIRKDGTRFYADVVLSTILNGEGKFVGYAKVTRDIIQRKEANDALLEAKIAAEAANRAKSQFVANMSHEIRTPMNAVLGMLQMLQHTELTPRQLDYVQKTHSAATTLLGILNDILDFSKVEAGKLELERAPFRFDKLLRNLSVVLSAAVHSKQLEVLFDLDTAIPHAARGDQLRLQQILLNLAGNAIKFTEQGEVIISLRALHVAPDRMRIAIAVRDTGIGISEDKRKLIFEGFSQAEASTSRRYGGTGLGLAITQRLVRLMGGELKVESTPGQGSNFHFELELPRDEETLSLERDAHMARNPANLPRRMRVLIVDDNAAAREVLTRMVGHMGWEAITVDSGAAALQRLREARAQESDFEVIFIDWVMPGMDGWETVQHIRAEHLGPKAPVVIMVTAHGRELLAERLGSGTNPLDGFLVKPVTPSMLFDAVADATSGASVATMPQHYGQSGQKRLAGLRLLVVEDNLMNQQVAQELLSYEGAYVDVASNGRQGIARVANADKPFDAVLLDIQMPDIDGYEATRILRNEKGYKLLPIIAMTANALPADREACLAAGMDDHIGKPFDIRQVVSILLQHCRPSSAAAAEDGVSEGCDAMNAPLPAVPEGFSLAEALVRLGHNRSLFVELLRQFCRDHGTTAQALADLLRRGDRRAAERTLHTLKGLAAAVGAQSLAQHAKDMEARIKAGTDVVENDKLLDRLKMLLDETITVLTRAADEMAVDEPVPVEPALADPSRALELLASLSVLLEENNMHAVDVYGTLKRELGGALGEHLAALDEAMGRLDFVMAQDRCRNLRRVLKQ